MLRRIISSFLILIVLIGTVGVSYDSHFCGGRFIKSKISFIPTTLSCGMKIVKQNKSEQNRDSFSRVCCSNEHSSFELGDNFIEGQSGQLLFVNNLEIPEGIFEEFTELKGTRYEFLGYSPPPQRENKLTLHQTFLI